jgi:hypothetical protein
MPNWANGYVKVSGSPKNVENFCKLFVFYEDENKETKRHYFARSFTQVTWKEFKKEHLGGKTAEFSVDFAWSCHSCMVEGYPDGKNLITLKEACKKFKVDVSIETEEEGCCFEENVTCDKEGNLTEECFDLPDYKCKSCGAIQTIARSYDLDDVDCYECGKNEGWEAVN